MWSLTTGSLQIAPTQSLKRQMQSAQEKQVRQQRQQTMRREAFDARIRQLRQEHGLLARYGGRSGPDAYVKPISPARSFRGIGMHSERMAQVRQVQDLDELIARTETRVRSGLRRVRE